MINHPGRVIAEAQIGGLVRQAYERAATAVIATSGFAVTGICPYNPNKFSDADYAPSLTSDRPLPAECHQPATTEVSTGLSQPSLSQSAVTSAVTNAVSVELSVQSQPVTLHSHDLPELLSLFTHAGLLVTEFPASLMMSGDSEGQSTQLSTSHEMPPDANISPGVMMSVDSDGQSTTQMSTSHELSPDANISAKVMILPEILRPYPVATRVQSSSTQKRKNVVRHW
jgi:hypothetical protein